MPLKPICGDQTCQLSALQDDYITELGAGGVIQLLNHLEQALPSAAVGLFRKLQVRRSQSEVKDSDGATAAAAAACNLLVD